MSEEHFTNQLQYYITNLIVFVFIKAFKFLILSKNNIA